MITLSLLGDERQHLRPWLLAGAEHFDHGRYWEAHESWEHAWRAYHGADRHYLKGLIQLAAANYHLVRHNQRAARRLFDTAAHHLAHGNPLAWPFDNAHLLVATAAAARHCERGGQRHPLTLRLTAMVHAGA